MTALSTALAVKFLPFSGWDEVKRRSPDIIIARCSRIDESTQGLTVHDLLVDSDIEVISVLRGTTNRVTGPLTGPGIGAGRLLSMYYPRQGQYYLIFSIYGDGEYQAIEDYRVIPLGPTFFTNSLAGKTFDEQIRMLFQRRLYNLNREIQTAQEEKQRLEEGLKK